MITVFSLMYYYLHVNGTLTTFEILSRPAPHCHLFPVYVPLAVINVSSQAFLAVDPVYTFLETAILAVITVKKDLTINAFLLNPQPLLTLLLVYVPAYQAYYKKIYTYTFESTKSVSWQYNST